MERCIRKVKLHVNVQRGEEGDPAHLIAVSNLRLSTAQSAGLWLLFDTGPSLRTARKQEKMHLHAHAWAQAPETLRSIEMPDIVEDLGDALGGRGDDAEWYLQVDMPGYGSYMYSVRPVFGVSWVTFVVNELILD